MEHQSEIAEVIIYRADGDRAFGIRLDIDEGVYFIPRVAEMNKVRECRRYSCKLIPNKHPDPRTPWAAVSAKEIK